MDLLRVRACLRSCRGARKRNAPELLVDWHAAGHIDGLAAHAARLRQALRVEVADDDAGSTKKLRAGSGGEADGTGTSNVDGGACGVCYGFEV